VVDDHDLELVERSTGRARHIMRTSPTAWLLFVVVGLVGLPVRLARGVRVDRRAKARASKALQGVQAEAEALVAACA